MIEGSFAMVSNLTMFFMQCSYGAMVFCARVSQKGLLRGLMNSICKKNNTINNCDLPIPLMHYNKFFEKLEKNVRNN
jgi:hypothetical protein